MFTNDFIEPQIKILTNEITQLNNNNNDRKIKEVSNCSFHQLSPMVLFDFYLFFCHFHVKLMRCECGYWL